MTARARGPRLAPYVFLLAASSVGCGVDLLEPDGDSGPGARIHVALEHDDRWALDLNVVLIGDPAGGPVRLNGTELSPDDVEDDEARFGYEADTVEPWEALRVSLPSEGADEFTVRVPLLEREGDGTVVDEPDSPSLTLPFRIHPSEGLEEERASWNVSIRGEDGERLLWLRVDGSPHPPLRIPMELIGDTASTPASATLVAQRRFGTESLGYRTTATTNETLTWTIVSDG